MATFAKRAQHVMHSEDFSGTVNPRADKAIRMQALHSAYVPAKQKHSQPGNQGFFRRLLKSFGSADRADG